MTTAGSYQTYKTSCTELDKCRRFLPELSSIQLLAREVPTASPEPFDTGNFQNLADHKECPEGFRCSFRQGGGGGLHILRQWELDRE